MKQDNESVGNADFDDLFDAFGFKVPRWVSDLSRTSEVRAAVLYEEYLSLVEAGGSEVDARRLIEGKYGGGCSPPSSNDRGRASRIALGRVGVVAQGG